MTRAIRFLACAALAVGIATAPAAAASARSQAPAFGARAGDTSDFSFRSFDAVYQLGRDASDHATLAVTETIVALFPQTDQNRGIVRDIPNRYGSADLKTEVVSVVDENGTPVNYTSKTTGSAVELALGTDAYVHGPTTYVISYTQVDTVRHFTDTDDDEFYWDVNGTEWLQTFQEVSAQVNVSDDLVSALNGHNACYEGVQGSKAACASGVVTASPTFTALATDVTANSTLTIVIGFAPGTFVDVSSDPNNQPDSSTAMTGAQTAGVLLSLLGFPAALIGVISAVSTSIARRQPARSTIVPQYSPPAGVDVMVAGLLLAAPTTLIPAQLVSLSVKGKTRLLGYPVESTRGSDYSVQLLDATGLDPLEQGVVDGLFGEGAKAGVSHDLQKYGDDEVAARLRMVEAAATEQVGSYFGGRRRTAGGTIAFVVASALTLTALIGALVLGGFAGLVVGFIGIVAGLVGVVAAFIGFRGRPQLTDEGAELNDYLLGMKMYLELAEADRLRVLQSPTGAERIDVADGKQLVKLYEKLLPWAIIWGVERQWSKVLEVELQRQNTAPDFWVGQQPFSSLALLPLISSIGPATSEIPSTTSTGSGGTFSSFGGGSFGGGFSGGGGGGGGGGGR